MGKSNAANWAARWTQGVPDRANDSSRKMSGPTSANSPDMCESCGHTNMNKYCECCQGGCK